MAVRNRLGIIALALLALALVAYLASGTDGQYLSLAAALLRVGLVLLAIWLALPQLERAPSWLFGGVILLAIILARWPKYFVLALMALAAAALLKPRLPTNRRRGEAD